MANIKRWVGAGALVVVLLLTFGTGWVIAKLGIGSAMDPSTLPERERQFAERMQNVTMVGYFTIAGREGRAPREDRYDIYSVEKVGEDRWRFNAKIGENGVTLPVTVTMRWVDDTPMIMLTDMSIPSMGTFTARVFFYGDRYAGTWEHGGAGGGYMYGRVEKSPANPR